MTTINAVNTTLSGQTGTGNFVGSSGPTLIGPILGAASATSLGFSSTSGIIGTTTNDAAAAGSVGELISSVIASGSAVSLTNNTPANVTSISLTAGDWDVQGNISFTPGSSTIVNYTTGWSSSTSATLPDRSLYTGRSFGSGLVIYPYVEAMSVPFIRLSLSGTTTVYLSCQCGFTTSTLTACGGIFARRRR